ncbi:Hypothetical predicted protein, partial [Cloeon dipterum]
PYFFLLSRSSPISLEIWWFLSVNLLSTELVKTHHITMAFSCSICLSFCDGSSDIFFLPGGPMYHKTCTLQWLSKTQPFPYYRNPTTAKNSLKLFPDSSEHATQQEDPSHQLVQTVNDLNSDIRKLTKSHDESQAALRKQIQELKSNNEEMSAEISRQTSHISLLEKQHVKLLKDVEKELQATVRAKEKAHQEFNQLNLDFKELNPLARIVKAFCRSVKAMGGI